MVLESKRIDKGYDKEWANDTLRYAIHDIINDPGWNKHPENVVILCRDLMSFLESHGFWWQSERIKNHLHLWMKKRRFTSKDDTLVRGGSSC